MTAVGPRTKGLRLEAETSAEEVTAELAAAAGTPSARVGGGRFSWPLLTLDDAALTHNLAVAARVCAARGVVHAPHVKTHMSAALWARQEAAGAWGSTVATGGQLRTVADWGVRRAFLANELLDARDAAWLRAALEGGTFDEVWLEVDSARGVEVLELALAGARPDVAGRLEVLVEVGLPGGRTGVRGGGDVLALARAVRAAGLRLAGVAGYEGSAAAHTDPAGLAAVGAWCDRLRAAGERVRAAGLLGGPGPGRAGGAAVPLVLSAGGSAFLDVVLDRLPADDRTRVVVRPGAYVTQDHGHYAEADPWSRIDGAEPLLPAITVWGQVLSVPEPGLALLGVGRRDVAFDIDLPFPLWARTPGGTGALGPERDLVASGSRVTALNDQHAFLAFGPGAGTDGDVLAPGDVVGLGVSHPCTTLDKWRVAAVTRGDDVVDLYTLDF